MATARQPSTPKLGGFSKAFMDKGNDSLRARSKSVVEAEIDMSKMKQQVLEATWEDHWNTFRAIYISVLLLTCWILGGTLFYHFWYDWSLATAFYYAGQAGLSIGFGSPHETDDGSKLFTIFFVFCGSSFICSSLALFVGNALDNQNEKWEELMASKTSKSKAAMELRKATLNLSLTERNTSRTCACCGDTCSENCTEVHECFRKFCCTSQCLDEHKGLIYVTVMFTACIFAGTMYGLIVEEWSFISSLYFAVCGLSTGGLTAPSVYWCDPTSSDFTDCELDNHENDSALSFVGIWILIGVPVYALTLGTVANVFIDDFAAKRMAKKLTKAINENEMQYLRRLCRNSTQSISYAEYMQFALLRLGTVDDELLERIRTQFQTLDADGSGTLSVQVWT